MVRLTVLVVLMIKLGQLHESREGTWGKALDAAKDSQVRASLANEA